VEAIDLELPELEEESLHELLKHVPAFTHQLLRLLLSHHTVFIHFGSLEVGESDYEDLLQVPRDFHKVHMILNLMEVSVEDLSFQVDPILIVAHDEGRGPLLGNEVHIVPGVALGLHEDRHGDEGA